MFSLATMNCNIDKETGIRYGTVYMNELKSSIWEEIESLDNLSYEDWKQEAVANLRGFVEDCEEDEYERIEEAKGEAVAEEWMDNRDIHNDRNQYDIDDWTSEILEHWEHVQGAHDILDEWNPDNYEVDEPRYAGTITLTKDSDGVEGFMEVELLHLGGAALLFIFKSPVIKKANLCSPNIPNAGDLSREEFEDGWEAYSVPDSWWATDDEY